MKMKAVMKASGDCWRKQKARKKREQKTLLVIQ